MPATTRSQHQARMAELEDLATAVENLRNQLAATTDDFDQRLGARVQDAQRLTHTVNGLTERANTTEPTQRTPFNQIEPFHGRLGNDFDQWLARFDAVARACNWTENRQIQIIPAMLTENAHEIYLSLPDADKTDFQRFRAALSRLLQPAENRRFRAAELHARKQGPAESAEDYASSVQRLARGAYSHLQQDVRTSLQLEAFLQGLRPQLQQFVTLSNPQTFADALATARRLEAQSALSTQNAQQSVPANFVSALLNALPALQTSRAHSDGLNQIREGPAQNLTPQIVDAKKNHLLSHVSYLR